MVTKQENTVITFNKLLLHTFTGNQLLIQSNTVIVIIRYKIGYMALKIEFN